jgi:ABC-2 type transport system ATP-binding protein
VDGNIIELVDLTKKYGSFTAVNQLNLSIRKSEIFGLLGPNGAGKSTTILMMLGLTDPTSGSVTVCGINPTTNPIEAKRRIGYLPEDVGFYYNRTGAENLIYTAQLNGSPEKLASQSAEQLLARVGLSEESGKKTGKYSRGMLQRLGLADVLIKNPEVIILDEPTLGIDPTGVREFLDLIVALSREEGITVLFSSHDLHHVQQVCDRVGLFVGGKLLAEGDIQSLSRKLFAKSPYVIEARLSVKEEEKSEGELIFTAARLQALLINISGVNEVTKTNDLFEIGCSSDTTAEIARVLVDAGIGILHLNKKEYGLADIYYRYFEGGIGHE